MNIDDLLYEPISAPAPLYPFGVADIVGLRIGLIAPFVAVVCSINVAGAVEVWASNQGKCDQFWFMPGPDYVVEFIRKATPEEIASATANGMRISKH